MSAEVVPLDPHRQKLGGSTIGAAVGVDPYCSPIRLWLEMTGRIERPETQAMYLGRLLEPAVLLAVREQGYNVEPAKGQVLTRKDAPWVEGHPDGWADGAVVELKCAGHAIDALRPAHEAQVQTYLWLADCEEAIVAYLGGLRLDIFHVSRDEWAIGVMRKLGQEFMRHVYADSQPSVTGHDDDRAALLAAHPEGQAWPVRETREVRAARKELAALLYAEKERKKRIEHLRSIITSHMGEANELLNREGDTVATWRTVTSHRCDTTALKAAAPEVWAEFATETTTRRFVLT